MAPNLFLLSYLNTVLTIEDSSVVYNILVYYFVVYFLLILSDFKLGQICPTDSHFIVWKTYFALVLANSRI